MVQSTRTSTLRGGTEERWGPAPPHPVSLLQGETLGLGEESEKATTEPEPEPVLPPTTLVDVDRMDANGEKRSVETSAELGIPQGWTSMGSKAVLARTWKRPLAEGTVEEAVAASDIDPHHVRGFAEDLETHISTTFAGVNIARFKPNEYSDTYESLLKAKGVSIIQIEDPSTFDRELFTEKSGFYLKPEKVIWRLPAEPIETYLAKLDNSGRTRLKAQMKRSEGLEIDISPLTTGDFDAWYPIYDIEVAGRERGRRVIEADWARTREDLGSYQKLFLRDPATNELLGGAILKLDKNTQTCTIAYAAYCSRSHLNRSSVHFSLTLRDWIGFVTQTHPSSL